MNKRYEAYCFHIIDKATEYFGAEFVDYCGKELCFQIMQYMKITYGLNSENWELIDEDSEFFLEFLTEFTLWMKGA